MQFVDRLAATLLRVDRRRLGVFPEGWGDRLVLDVLATTPAPADPIPDLDVVWGRKEENRGTRIRRGSVTSPVADLLPIETRAVPLEMIEPSAGTERVVLLMPAWNDHGFATRRLMATLLAERGIGSVMFDVPFYGSRRVVAQPAQAIRTVADFMKMGYGAVHEGRALLALIATMASAGVSGYSMGGNLAALVSASVPFPIATAAHAAAPSPGPVYLDGVLSTAIRWSALGGRGVSDELRSVLSGISVLDVDPLPHHAAAVMVAGRRDGFVPPSATEQLHRHWAGSELTWLDAGHATLIGRHRDALADSVARAFDRLDAM